MSYQTSVIHSIPETISMAFVTKQAKYSLLGAIAIVTALQVFSSKTIEIKEHQPVGVLPGISEPFTEEDMTIMGYYYSVRYGNISSKSMKEIERMAIRTQPASMREAMIQQTTRMSHILKDTGVGERFIPNEIEVHKELNRVWVTGTLHILAKDRKPKKTQVTKVYDFKTLRGFAYPIRYELQQGQGTALQEITKYIAQKEND